jgi:hypothetical protein
LATSALNANYIAADCLHGLIEFLLTTARDEEVSTFSDEALGCGQPYTGFDASNDSRFSLQFTIGCEISFKADIQNQSVLYECTRLAVASRNILHHSVH